MTKLYSQQKKQVNKKFFVSRKVLIFAALRNFLESDSLEHFRNYNS